jgi:hypothetical protein
MLPPGAGMPFFHPMGPSIFHKFTSQNPSENKHYGIDFLQAHK